MFSPRLRHTDQWRFGVFWQDGGDGGDSGGPGGGASTGQGGAPSGGSTGDAGADAATAAANAAGVGNVGPGADANAAAVGGVTGQQGFQGFTGFGGSAADSSGFGISNAGAPPGSGVVGGGNVSFGGPGNVGGGVVGGTGGGGFGGPGVAVGAPGTVGAPTGGNAGGVAGGGFGFGQQMGTPDQNVAAATLGLGKQGVLTGLANAAPAGTVTSSPIGPPAIDQNTIAILNNELANLTRGGGGSFGFGDQSQASPLGAPGTTLGQLALASQRVGMNMGYPSIEGVSPGLTAAPAGPSPSPGQIGQPSLSQAPANPFGPAEVALAQDLAGATPAATAFASPVSPVSPAETETPQNTANLAAQVASQPAVTAAPPAPAPATTPASTGGFGQLFQDIFGGGVSNPATLPQLAAMLGIGGQLG